MFSLPHANIPPKLIPIMTVALQGGDVIMIAFANTCFSIRRSVVEEIPAPGPPSSLSPSPPLSRTFRWMDRCAVSTDREQM